MKFGRGGKQAIAIALPLFLCTVVSAIPGNLNKLHARDLVPAISPAIPKPSPVGTKDAPVDGKDGIPHSGPFVETSAERDRKKAKEAGEEAPLAKAPKVITQEAASGLDLPDRKDGVMNDPDRLGPKDGTRGTEGGVTEKSRDGTSGKVAAAPEKAPPLPHSEEQKIKGAGDSILEPASSLNEDKTAADDLKKDPNYLPGTDIPTTKYPKGSDTSGSNAKPATDGHEPAVISPMHSLFLSFTMILVSEIGDKTFLVAALMAMRHPRMLVFTAAFGALITMTILSALLGHAVPTLISPVITHFLAAVLFLVFGVKMLNEARKMSPDEGVGEEMREVEMELEEKEQKQRRASRRQSSIGPHALEAGRGKPSGRSSTSRLPSPPESPISDDDSREASPSRRSQLASALEGINNLLMLVLSPAWVQTFTMTFLGEWGDRSQIATIAMSAGPDYWWVVIGSLAGHSICTGVAVLGGAAIAGRVSMQKVTLGGAIAFLIFGVIYLFEAIY